jgi:hypothetical protein
VGRQIFLTNNLLNTPIAYTSEVTVQVSALQLSKALLEYHKSLMLFRCSGWDLKTLLFVQYALPAVIILE